ncbi:MAG: hypothetical protein K2W93_00755, partial [Burkholderiaceae bacterium]|nr:hypothetical protein [Burkholderiaceae bacterium]
LAGSVDALSDAGHVSPPLSFETSGWRAAHRTQTLWFFLVLHWRCAMNVPETKKHALWRA